MDRVDVVDADENTAASVVVGESGAISVGYDRPAVHSVGAPRFDDDVVDYLAEISFRPAPIASLRCDYTVVLRRPPPRIGFTYDIGRSELAESIGHVDPAADPPFASTRADQSLFQ